MTMTAAQFRAAYSYLGFSLTDFAATLGVKTNTARAWDKGRNAVPSGVAEEIEGFLDETDTAVDYLVHHYETHPAEWPMEIPRTPEDLHDSIPDMRLSFLPSLDWWKHVGIRVCRRVPGLTLEWG